MDLGRVLTGLHTVEEGSSEAAWAWLEHSQPEDVTGELAWRALIKRGEPALTLAMVTKWPDQVPQALLSWAVEQQADLVIPLVAALRDPAHPRFYTLVDQALTDGVEHVQWPGLVPLLRLVPDHAWSYVGFLKAFHKFSHLTQGSPEPLDALLTHAFASTFPETIEKRTFEVGGGGQTAPRLDLLDVFWTRTPTHRPRAVFAMLSNGNIPLHEIQQRLNGDDHLIEAVYDLLIARLKAFTNPERDGVSLDTLGCLVTFERQARWLAEHPGQLPRTAVQHEAIQRQQQAHQSSPLTVTRPRLRT